jgi:cell division protein FtsZ
MMEMLKSETVIVGIGGAGGNAVNNLRNNPDFPFHLIAVNTNRAALDLSLADENILLTADFYPGDTGTKGNPQIGREVTIACKSQVMERLAPFRTVVFLAGLGGSTGTGAMPVIALEAMQQGKNVICIATLPFHFEGKERLICAESALYDMRQSGLHVLVINNQDVFRIANERTTFADAFAIVDNAVYKLVNDLAAAGFDYTQVSPVLSMG